MITRIMNLQNKQDNLFKAFQKCSNPEMKEIWADKWRNISHVIQNISYEQAKENNQKRINHILKAVGIRIVLIWDWDKCRMTRGVYDLETNVKVTYQELIERWRIK